MSRIAIIGSCITRDLWPNLGEAPPDLLYVCRTSLPSLLATAAPGLKVRRTPPAGLRPRPHAAVVADLRKQALAELVAHRPTHIIFDFIDERFDLIRTPKTVVTHSWELETSGYIRQQAFEDRRIVPRLSAACDLMWRDALGELAMLLRATPLGDARLILHASSWARTYLDADGATRAFDPEIELLPGRNASITAHNALLDRYQRAFEDSLAPAVVRAAPERVQGDVRHRWGLSPFHYGPDYYAQVRDQLAALGV
ncbi:DUF6270 domain-containing protein [Phenylobacterium aquaticum]|uniref:DUF6270 domain-containing protein n=1 Tax=Phenylobacterium aquaticum TaxID=1763816 RepID=UPI0026EF2BF6|nr:DUF6270 domain-containing protein [Phenylobacterium aquaticum]